MQNYKQLIDIVDDIPEELGDTSYSKTISLHLKRNQKYENCSLFLWYSYYKHVADYMQRCSRC